MGLGSIVGCTTSSDEEPGPYDSLYDTAQSPNANASEVRGVWDLRTEQDGIAQQQRLRVTDETLTIANRCSTDEQGTVTVGVTVAITIAPGTMTVKDPGGQDVKRVPAKGSKLAFSCNASLTGPGDLPYALGNGELQLGGVKWRKVAD